MKRTRHLIGKVGFVLCTALWGTLSGHTTNAAEVSVGVSVVAIHTPNDFHEPLSPYGRWEVVGSDGNCWIPGGVASGWSPYSDGYWQQTDAGWYWASDEPWAWATYHYGGWNFDSQFGWYWVPQIQCPRMGFLARRRWIRQLGAIGPVGEILGKKRYVERLCHG